MTMSARGPSVSLKGRALRHLATREFSRAELQARLAPHVPPDAAPGELTRLLDELTAKGFINEARVAESVLYRRAGRLGNARVLHELRAKGLPEELLADAAEQLRDTELTRAREVWRKKFGQPPGDAAERARQMRFLAGRGFSAQTVRAVLAGPGDEDEDQGAA